MGIDRISQYRLQHTFIDGGAQRGRFQRKKHFNAHIQVALHHIRAAQVYFFSTIIAEIVDTAMFENTTNKTAHANSFTQSRHPWSQTAHATDNEINIHANLRGAIELLNDGGIDKR